MLLSNKQMSCCGYKRVSRFEVPCICTLWTGERQARNQREGQSGNCTPPEFLKRMYLLGTATSYIIPFPPRISVGCCPGERWVKQVSRLTTGRSRDCTAPLRRSSAGWLPARMGRLSAGNGRKHPVTIRKASFMAGSISFGFSDFRIFGFSDFRIFGFSDFRIFGFSDFRIFGFLDFWIFGFSGFGFGKTGVGNNIADIGTEDV